MLSNNIFDIPELGCPFSQQTRRGGEGVTNSRKAIQMFG